jgi:hypothetical protein
MAADRAAACRCWLRCQSFSAPSEGASPCSDRHFATCDDGDDNDHDGDDGDGDDDNSDDDDGDDDDDDDNSSCQGNRRNKVNHSKNISISMNFP